MPLLKPTDEIHLTGKGGSTTATLLAETASRLILLLPEAGPSFRADVMVQGEIPQGRYRASFQCHVLHCDVELHTKRQVLICEVPATLRRERL